jgi:molybdenum cofactor cytidylyltransferase
MKFGSVPAAQAAGSILAHGLAVGEATWRKGRVLDANDASALCAAGHAHVVVARLEEGDRGEDEVAAAVAALLAGEGVQATRATTGRANLVAAHAGVLMIDTQRIHGLNAVHEAITVGTLMPWTVVSAGDMLATVKIIPYAVPGAVVDAALSAGAGPPPLRVAQFTGIRVALLMTRLAATPERVLDKVRRAVGSRVTALGGELRVQSVIDHDEAALAFAVQALQSRDDLDLVLVSAEAATVDRGDVVPAALVAAGGEVLRAGMPVDPGNLLVLARLPVGAEAGRWRPAIGIPTCARSPRVNGFDWVLRRLAAGLEVSAADVAGMGVGGLLAGTGADT